MSQQHAEEQVTQGEEAQTIESTTAPATDATSEQTSVLPFNEEITTAKNHLNLLLDQLSLDGKRIQQRLDSLEPRQLDAEQQLSQQLTQLDALGRDVETKLQTLEQRQTQLADENSEEVQRIFKTLGLVEQRVNLLEPTPAKLELLAEKLEQVDNRLEAANQQLEGRVEELERRTAKSDVYLQDLKHRNHRLKEKSQDLDFARKQQAGTISQRSRLFAAIAALLLIAIVGIGYQLNGQQQLTAQQSAEIATVNAEVAALDASLNPDFNAASSAITIPVHDSDWVLAQKPEHLTIELFGSRSKSEAFNYIRQMQHLLVDPVSYVKTEHRGRDWYVVFYGNYATAEESQAIMSVLPPVLRQHDPKVRPFGWVQQQL